VTCIANSYLLRSEYLKFGKNSVQLRNYWMVALMSEILNIFVTNVDAVTFDVVQIDSAGKLFWNHRI
jgi:hypothetical protein